MYHYNKYLLFVTNPLLRLFFFRLSKMPVLQISKPLLQSFVILIVFAVFYAMMTINDFIWDIIIGLLAIVTLACLAYIAYISYVATIVLKTLVSKLLKKKETYEKRKSEKVNWNILKYWLYSFLRRVLDLCLIYHVETTKLLFL